MADLFTIDEMITQIRDVQTRLKSVLTMITDVITTRDRMFKEKFTGLTEIVTALDIKYADMSVILSEITNGSTKDLDTIDLTAYAFEFRTGNPESWHHTNIDTLIKDGDFSASPGGLITALAVDGVSSAAAGFSDLIANTDTIEIYDSEIEEVQGNFIAKATITSGIIPLTQELFVFDLEIVDISEATPGVVTTLQPHGINSGDRVWIKGVASPNEEVNNTTEPWIAASATEYTFALTTVAGADVAVTGTYVSGGFVAKDIPNQAGDTRFKFRVRSS